MADESLPMRDREAWNQRDSNLKRALDEHRMKSNETIRNFAQSAFEAGVRLGEGTADYTSFQEWWTGLGGTL